MLGKKGDFCWFEQFELSDSWFSKLTSTQTPLKPAKQNKRRIIGPTLKIKFVYWHFWFHQEHSWNLSIGSLE